MAVTLDPADPGTMFLDALEPLESSDLGCRLVQQGSWRPTH